MAWREKHDKSRKRKPHEPDQPNRPVRDVREDPAPNPDDDSHREAPLPEAHRRTLKTGLWPPICPLGDLLILSASRTQTGRRSR